MTPYQLHLKQWSNCSKCPLYKTRTQVVFVRGKLPCDVLFVGEAPGVSEDVIGRPFVGPAGKLLDRLITLGLNPKLRYAITNLVGCIPQENGAKRDPTPASIKACAPKLAEIRKIAKPRAIVRLGTLAKKYVVVQDESTEVADMIHPAAILRMDVSQQGLAIQRSIIVLQDLSTCFEEV